jgi:hypothetical protein
MARLPVLAALALLTAAPSLPQPARHPAPVTPVPAYGAIESVRWAYQDEAAADGSARRLRFEHDGSNASVDSHGRPDVQQVIETIARAPAGQAVAFSLVREAGTLACTGRVEAGGQGSGTCRFDPNDGFGAGLARRGIAPEDSDALLTLALVDAHLVTVDGLTAEGFRFDDAGDLTAVSALGVTPAYAGDLRGAGLEVDELGDLIAAKALGIDAWWLGEMARAGFPDLAPGQAIQMRALGVTPDYARRMARVLRTVGEIE